jgi:hypothetical protein
MRYPLAAAGLLVLTVAPAAQAPDASWQRIRQEGLERSHAPALFDHLTTVIGPRLTGTPAYRAAVDWAKAQLTGWGLVNVREEAFDFGRGWALERLTVEMIEPRYMPLVGYAEAWSAPTRGEIVAAPVFVGGRTAADVEAMTPRLRGALVLTQPEASFIREDRPQPTESDAPVRIGQPRNPGPRQDPAEARRIAQILREAGAAAILRTSAGEHGTVFVLGRDQGEHAMPTVVLAGEHYNLIARMLARAVPVKLRVNIQSRFLEGDGRSYNVLADLPGTDPALRDQIVLIGAHLDSWHTGTGATDNADGSAAVLEAMRILRAAGARPRRTIRVALWGGEEQGLLGSRAYVRQHLAGDANAAERDRHFVYFNLDPGMGPIYGWYLESTDAVRPAFDRWLAPLRDLGARRNIAQGIGSTDHLSFRAAGVPGFNPVQDYAGYDVRTHHTNMDTAERVRAEDLRQNAVAMAWFALQAANTDEAIPRVAPQGPGRRP